jgi:methylated-DNA-[protein]-cysteine S-methyltransferase
MQAKQTKPRQHDCVIASPLGKLGLTITNNKLAKVQFLPSNIRLFVAQNSIARQIAIKIKKYFCNPKLQFKLPIQIKGTPLQQKIWKVLQKIPCGKTITYGELAQKIGTSPRVIGNACRRNPIPIVIPCHRVVRATGFGGYCGKTSSDFLKIKKWLLVHEGA